MRVGDTRVIFKFSGKIPYFNERLKTCLIGLNMFSWQCLTIVNEILKPGFLLAFKLLNALFNSSSSRRYSSKLVLAEHKS